MPKLEQRSDTAANWTSNNPTLGVGEIGFETDTGKFKIGNNTATWTALDYGGGGISVASEAEIKTGTDDTKAISPLKAAAFIRYANVVASGGVDDSAALQATLDAAATSIATLLLNYQGTTATVRLPPGKVIRAANINVPANVNLDLNGSTIRANAAGYVVKLNGDFAGIISSSGRGEIHGGYDNTPTVACRGVVVATGKRWTYIQDIFIDQCGLEGMDLEASTSVCTVERVLAFNCLRSADTLPAMTGVLRIRGFDHYVDSCEVTASRPTWGGMSATGFAAAVYLAADECFIRGLQAELSDHGMYIAGGGGHKIHDCRADLNRGHGFYIVSGEGSIIGCRALRNGQQTNNTYDGFNVSGTSTKFLIDACSAYSGESTNKHRYGFRDTTTNQAFNQTRYGPSNRSLEHVTAAISVDPAFGAYVTAATNNGAHSIVGIGTDTTYDLQLFGWPITKVKMAATAARTWGSFINAAPGQRIVIKGDGLTTIPHNATFKNQSGANLLLAASTAYVYELIDSVWYQV